jgi:hypothetical protein
VARPPTVDPGDERGENLPGRVGCLQFGKFTAAEHQRRECRPIVLCLNQRKFGKYPRLQNGILFSRCVDPAAEFFKQDSGNVHGKAFDNPLCQCSIAMTYGPGPDLMRQSKTAGGVPIPRVGGDKKSMADPLRYRIVS